MKYPPYPIYKPSGVAWLGNVPDHWETRRLKYCASLNDDALLETSDPELEMDYVDIGNVDEIRGINGSEQVRFENAPSRARRLVRDGDTIFSTVRTYLRAIAPIRRPSQSLVVSTGFAVIRPRKVDPGFLSYALREKGLVDTVVARSVGVSYPAVGPSDVGSLPIPYPRAEEQRSIAAFLDCETGKIDTLIAKKRELIEKLNEKRSALISQVVTRGLPPEAARAAGLDPHPKLKPSGIDWLGDIPDHWELISFKRLCQRTDVGIAEAATHAYCDDGVPIIRSTNVHPNSLDMEDVLHIEPWFATRNQNKTLRAGDLLTVRTGHPGTTAVVPPEYEGSQCFTLVISSLHSSEHPAFFSYYLNSAPGSTYFETRGWGTAQTNISVPIVQELPVVRPPLGEQRAIVEFLSLEMSRLDKLTDRVKTAVDSLQEYRAALITAAVSGQIDVRETAG